VTFIYHYQATRCCQWQQHQGEKGKDLRRVTSHADSIHPSVHSPTRESLPSVHWQNPFHSSHCLVCGLSVGEPMHLHFNTRPAVPQSLALARSTNNRIHWPDLPSALSISPFSLVLLQAISPSEAWTASLRAQVLTGGFAHIERLLVTGPSNSGKGRNSSYGRLMMGCIYRPAIHAQCTLHTAQA
jgi:hypothetical protein